LKIVNTRVRAVQFRINGRRPVNVAGHSHFGEEPSGGRT
jgi:hypothetical protein